MQQSCAMQLQLQRQQLWPLPPVLQQHCSFVPLAAQPHSSRRQQRQQPLQKDIGVLSAAGAGHSSCRCSALPHNSSHSLGTSACVSHSCSTQPSNGASGHIAQRAAVAAQAAGKGRGPAWRPPRQPQPQQQPQPQPAPPAPSPPPIVDPSTIDSEGLAGMFMSYAKQIQESMQQPQQPAGVAPGANVVAKNIGFHPPGAEAPLLDSVNFHLKPNQLGLIIGRSGSGKTTLLQLLAGLTEQTSGDVFIHRPSPGDHPSGLFLPTHIEQRMQQVGLVFQFPERHFLGDDVMQEMTFTWPRAVTHWGQRQAMAVRMQQVIDAVGLSDIPFNIPPSALSGGQQRRLALALQLVRAPSLLLLDEPLAGLDWHARREVVSLLRELKKQATLLVVSHDLADIAPLVDCAWRMQMGGQMESVQWPPDSLSDVED